jgi:negative regulator of replication initiation
MSVVYQYIFSQSVPLGEIEATLLRTLLTAEYLHGPARVRLDAAHYLDAQSKTCVVDATTPVGDDVNKLFVGALETEFGPDSFSVERVANRPDAGG